MFLLQMPLLKRIPVAALTLITLGFGVGIARDAAALEMSCNAGRCTVDGTNLRVVGSSTLFLSGSYTLQPRLPLGVGATVVDDLLPSVVTEGGCNPANGRSLCVSSATAVNQLRLFAIRSRSSAVAQFTDWHFAVRSIVPNSDPVPTPPGGITNPIPEPSAALIFGVGLLVASGLVTRTGMIE